MPRLARATLITDAGEVELAIESLECDVLQDGHLAQSCAVAREYARTPEPCPACGAWHVHGPAPSIGGHDYYTARALCARPSCRLDRGELRGYVSTIYGLDEDRRVLDHGRCRVY